MTQRTSASAFYDSPEVVAEYERGRTTRIFVKHFPEAIRVAIANGVLDQIPLYALFDWFYNRRLRALSLDLLGSGDILDLACGTSYVYRSLLADGWTGRVTGIDRSRAMIEEGTRQLQWMLRYRPAKRGTTGGFFRYQDALGRSVLDIAPARNLINPTSIRFLLDHRHVGDATKLPSHAYSVVTAFSGPFCYYPTQEQEHFVRHVCTRAERTVSLQFKNAAFAKLTSSEGLTQSTASIIAHILDHRIADSYAFLKAIDFNPCQSSGFRGSMQIEHEVGGFHYYPTSVDLVRDWLGEAGFTIVKRGTMGFVSQTFYELAQAYYDESHGDPSLIEILFRALEGIDEYFCGDMLMGDNLQVTAAKTSDLKVAPVEYRSSRTFRSRYHVRG